MGSQECDVPPAYQLKQTTTATATKTSLQNIILSYSTYFMIIPSSLYYTIYIGEVSYKWIDMDGFEVKSETERFTVVCPCCRHGREMYKNA